MHPRRRFIQLTCVLLVSISGTLLGLSQGTWQLTVLSVAGAVAGFLIVDYLQWFRLQGWLANIASILILLYAMSEFYSSANALKLISVGKLLVYLQTVLMFQEKTPRLYWQVLVLTLLQVVVAAIFNLNFEGGVLFLVYFAVAGAMMMLQCDLTQWFEVRRVNETNVEILDARAGQSGNNASVKTVDMPACMVFEPQYPRSYRRMFAHLVPWFAVAFVFSTVLFYNIPRTDSSWLGPGFKKVSATGASLGVDLNNRGALAESGLLVFRATFINPVTNAKGNLPDPPYFRGGALNRLVTKDGYTDWRAPYDSVYQFSYLRPRRDIAEGQTYRIQEIALEATTDPLLFSVFPFRRLASTPREVEFVRDISALSRRRRGDIAEMGVYKYSLAVLTDKNGRPLQSWPYEPDIADVPYRTMKENPGEFKSLVWLEPERYPTLVRTAQEIADATGTDDPMVLAKALNRHFTSGNGYSYTTDFSTIERDETLDPVEDFCRNFKTGHCQLYASALAIMLRSQNIPARLAIGYLGNEYNDATDSYMVRGMHAHAWVEAYIPPESCTPEMMASGAAGRGGAWLMLDPTSGVYREDQTVVPGRPLELARTLWQDYVLGMDSRTQPDPININNSKVLGLLDLSRWQSIVEDVSDRVENRPVWRLGFITVVCLVIGGIVYGLVRSRTVRVRAKPRRPVSRIRKMLGDALFWISPELGSWVMGDAYVLRIVPFYERMTAWLKRHHRLQREPTETHREFVRRVAKHFAQHPQRQQIEATVRDITDAFYAVRFGLRDLSASEVRNLEQRLKELERIARESVHQDPADPPAEHPALSV